MMSPVIFVAGLVMYRLRARMKMWFNMESVKIAMAKQSARGTVDADAVRRAERKREIERKILEDGIATCIYCEEEIHHNPDMSNGGWTWESEDLLGWCDKSSQHRHAPRVVVPDD